MCLQAEELSFEKPFVCAFGGLQALRNEIESRCQLTPLYESFR